MIIRLPDHYMMCGHEQYKGERSNLIDLSIIEEIHEKASPIILIDNHINNTRTQKDKPKKKNSREKQPTCQGIVEKRSFNAKKIVALRDFFGPDSKAGTLNSKPGNLKKSRDYRVSKTTQRRVSTNSGTTLSEENGRNDLQ